MTRWRRFLRWAGIGCWDCGRLLTLHNSNGPFCLPCLGERMQAVVREWTEAS